jgi:uncharacterized small protein (DUF1192 family)
MTVSVEELREKVERVKSDIQRMQSAGDGMEKIAILTDYLDYLKDELSRAENGEH